MQAMVLCAGLGTRLRPLTERIPKPLVPAPCEPLVHHTLRSLSRAGVARCVLNLHHLPDAVRGAIGKRFEGMEIIYSHEPEILGPTGGIRKALHVFGDDPFIVVNGDVFVTVDWAAMMAFHKQSGAGLCIAAKTDGDEALRALGFDEANRLRQVWDTPHWDGPVLRRGINIGAFIYDPALVRRFVPQGCFYGFREDFVPALFAAGEAVSVFPCAGYWSDVGTPETYLAFVRDIFNGRVPGVNGAHHVSPGAVVHPNAEVVSPCHLDSGCEVHAGAVVGPYAVIAAGARIRERATVENSVVAPGVCVLPDSCVANEIVTR